jgi:hypothetical protein
MQEKGAGVTDGKSPVGIKNSWKYEKDLIIIFNVIMYYYAISLVATNFLQLAIILLYKSLIFPILKYEFL